MFSNSPQHPPQHHHSSKHHHSSTHHHSSKHRHSSKSTHSYQRGTEILYSQKKTEVDRITSTNIPTERDALKRTVAGLAILGFAGVVGVFFLVRNSYEGGLVRPTCISASILGIYIFFLALFRHFKDRQLHLKALIQFQETRIDSLKATLVQKQRKLEDLESQIPPSSDDADSQGKDYRKISGLV